MEVLLSQGEVELLSQLRQSESAAELKCEAHATRQLRGTAPCWKLQLVETGCRVRQSNARCEACERGRHVMHEPAGAGGRDRNCKSWYEPKQVCGIRPMPQLVLFRTRIRLALA